MKASIKLKEQVKNLMNRRILILANQKELSQLQKEKFKLWTSQN